MTTMSYPSFSQRIEMFEALSGTNEHLENTSFSRSLNVDFYRINVNDIIG